MTHYRNGAEREYRVRDYLLERGWHIVARAAGSHGAADLVMVHPDHGLALVQVGSRTKALGPAARKRLTDLAELCGALALLAVVIPREPIRFSVVTRDVPSKWQEWAA